MGEGIGRCALAFRPCGLAVLAAILLLSLGVSARAQEYHDNVVIILDSSGSMSEAMGPAQKPKLDVAKAALKQVLTKLPESVHLGLLVFSGVNVSDKWLYPLGPRNDDTLLRAIDMPQPAGNTPLGEFIKIGADRLLEERARQFGYGSYRLLIVTDGEATDGSLTDDYAPIIVARGITVDVIGVNMKSNHTLATKVHSYRRADDPQALTKALTEILGEVSTSGADAITRDAFDLLAPIPAETATAVVEALAREDNRPIGSAASLHAPLAPVAASPLAANAPAPASAPVKQSNSIMWLVLFFVAWGVISVLRHSLQRRRR